jgi:MATE family multidrug resistance protein
MVAVLVGNVVNLVLVTALVRGLGFGLGGAAAATTAVRWVMFAWLVRAALPTLREASPTGPVLSRPALRAAAASAAPVALQMGLEVWAFNAGVFLAGRLGATEAAAHTVALNLASLSFMVPLGVASAAATRVGNAVGAGSTGVGRGGRRWRPGRG